MADDHPDFKASQARHAEKIKSERTVMRLLGVNRSQARQILAQRLIAARAAFQDRRSPLFQPPPPVQVPEIKLTKQELPMPQKPASAPKQDNPVPPTLLGDIELLALNVNGQLALVRVPVSGTPEIVELESGPYV